MKSTCGNRTVANLILNVWGGNFKSIPRHTWLRRTAPAILFAKLIFAVVKTINYRMVKLSSLPLNDITRHILDRQQGGKNIRKFVQGAFGLGKISTCHTC